MGEPVDRKLVRVIEVPLYREDFSWEAVVDPREYFVEVLEVLPNGLPPGKPSMNRIGARQTHRRRSGGFPGPPRLSWFVLGHSSHSIPSLRSSRRLAWTLNQGGLR